MTCGNDYILKELNTLKQQQDQMSKKIADLEKLVLNQEADTDPSKWSAEEHQSFIIGLERFGKHQHKKVSNLVKTKNHIQCASHSQKIYKKIKLLFNSPS
jgi:SHAQKYF class myb-like DNA-binding protein